MWIQRMGLRMSLVAMGSVKVVAGVALKVLVRHKLHH